MPARTMRGHLRRLASAQGHFLGISTPQRPPTASRMESAQAMKNAAQLGMCGNAASLRKCTAATVLSPKGTWPSARRSALGTPNAPGMRSVAWRAATGSASEQFQCLDDRPCRDGQKCCFTGCGLNCTALEPHDSEEDVAQNCTREQSPHGAPSRGKKPHRKRHCHHDRECPEGETCCHDGRCKTECQEEVSCHLPLDLGYYGYEKQSIRFYYNLIYGRCEKFLYRGSGGNTNNFADEFACVYRCVDSGVCVLPLNDGVGEYFKPRYFFNFITKECQLFWFRGYGGNENNFRELESCNWRCPRVGNVAAASRSSPSVTLGARSSGEAKPGRCPVITAGCCILQCIDDSDCPGDEKCCGLTCEKPAF